MFRARFVEYEYSQVPGVNCNESFAPLINDISFSIMLRANHIWALEVQMIDVEN
jgi:hypothetical protein